MKIKMKCFVATGGRDPELGTNGYEETFFVETDDCQNDETVFWAKAETAANALTDRFSSISEDSIETASNEDEKNLQAWLHGEEWPAYFNPRKS